MVGWMDDRLHGWVNVCVDRLLIVARTYGRLLHARGPLPMGLRALRHARGPAGLLPTNNQYPHSPIMHPIIHQPNHPSIHSPTHPFTHPFIFTSIHSPIHSSTHPFIHPFGNTSIHASRSTTNK